MSTREPGARPGPVFTIVRGATSCAWAVRVDVPEKLAEELGRLARTEPPTPDLRAAPVHWDRCVSLVGGRLWSGPAFTFPDDIAQSADVVSIEDERQLERHFRGWVPGEIATGRAPVLAVLQDGVPVSVCCCARRSDVAAEAGLETAEEYRGRGFGTRVAAAWAVAVRASGRVPLYSASWDNGASLAVARKLGLVAYASDWSLYG